MFKKTLISLAVASSVGLTGCFDSAGSGSGNANPNYQISNPEIDGKTWPVFNPLTSELPIPNDLIFDSEQGDGTFGVADTTPPVTTALNELSGGSTVAPTVISFNGRIDASTVKGLVDKDGNPTGGAQTVFMIELDYASGDPVQGLSHQESPTISAEQPLYRADVEILDGVSAIRVLPLEPLDPRKRYVVVVTNEITDQSGEAIIQSPSYNNASDEDQPLGNAALEPVRALVNGLWETIASNYFSVAVNPLRDGSSLDASNIAVSYSFTTSNDEEVLKYIAEPATWFADQITTFVRVSAAKRVTGAAQFFNGATLDPDNWDLNGDGEVTAEDFDRNSDGEITPADFLLAGNSSFGHADLLIASNEAEDNFPMSLPPNPDSPLNPLFGGGGPCEGDLGEAAINCVGVALASQFAADLPTPLPGVNRNVGGELDIQIDGTTVTPVGLVSAVAGTLPGSDTVLTAQGTVSLPTYMGTTASEALSQSWVADNELAESLNEVFGSLGVSIPQADPSVSTAVNYVFPFPKKRGEVDVPVLTLYPADGADFKGVVMFQHGITTDRSTALTFGTPLAAAGYAVVAIDQPLHGVTPFSEEEQLALAAALLEGAGVDEATAESLAPALVAGKAAFDDAIEGTPLDAAIDEPTRLSLVNTVANAGSRVPGLAPTDAERHFGVYSDDNNQPQPMVFDSENAEGTDGSGSFYINLTNFLNTRDNNRQSAVDQMNLRVSLSGVELTTQANGPIEISGGTPVFFAGHSLGTITGTPFVTAVNQNRIGRTICTDAVCGGDIPSQFNDILAANMLTPGGGVVRLLENSPSFAPTILLGLQQAAGLSQGDANLETYFNVLQATIDSSDPVNFIGNLDEAGTPTLLSVVIGDSVIPNAADASLWGEENGRLSRFFPASETGLPVGVNVDSFNAPLAGSLPLAIGGNISLTTYDPATFDGVNHGTPVDPTSSTAAFIQMTTEAVNLFDSQLTP